MLTYENGKELFGKMVKDKESGFVGIITGFATYPNEEDKFLVTKDISNGGDFKNIWFNSRSLELVD